MNQSSYLTRTILKIVDIARRAGRFTDLHLPCRQVAQCGISRTTASRHLQVLCRLGWLNRVSDSKNGKAATYSVSIAHLNDQLKDTAMLSSWDNQGTPLSSEDCPTMIQSGLEQAPVYQELMGWVHFRQGARIDPRLWTTEPPSETFGDAALRLISTLEVHQPTSKSELWRLANVHSVTGARKLGLLEAFDVVACTPHPDNARRLVPRLNPEWRARLKDLESALVTFGMDVITEEASVLQRIRYHRGLAKKLRGDARIHSECVIENAQEQLKTIRQRKRELLKRRKMDAHRRGISQVPPLGSSPSRP